jgi:hypothetical protein
MDKTILQYPEAQPVHVIMDNCRIRKYRGERLAAHPNARFHLPLRRQAG